MIIALSILGTWALLSMMLFLTEVAERRVISEPVLIAQVARAPKLTPEYVEAFVASRAERLMSGS